MSKSFGAIFGGILAVALLLLYAVSAWSMILAILAVCPGTAECSLELAKQYNDGFRYVLTTVGGLVSALVIARLSITEPGAIPNFSALHVLTVRARTASNVVVSLYLLVWGATGLASLVVGVMLHPNVIPTVSDLGTVWLGLAVAAGYAYFGLTPPESPGTAMMTAARTASGGTVAALENRIATGRIIFDQPSLKDQLLGLNSGQKVTPKLQALVLSLSDTSVAPIRISSLIRTGGHHGEGRAVDIGNEEIAADLLPKIVPQIGSLSIDDLIFDASVAGKPDRNTWNHNAGVKHDFDTATLDQHKDHIHFSVAS